MTSERHKNISPDRSFFVDSHITFSQVAFPKPFHSLIKMWFKRQIGCLGVRQKLIYSYVLVTCCVLLVVLAGRTIEIKYLQELATEKLFATETVHLVNELEKAVLKTKIQQQQLLLTLDSPQAFQQESPRLLAATKTIKQLLNETKSFISCSDINHDQLSLKQKCERASGVLASEQRTINAYSQQLEILLQPGGSQNLNPQQQNKLRQSLIVFSRSQVASNFNNLPGDLQQWVELYRAEQIRMLPKIQSQQVMISRTILFITSLVVIFITSILVFYITRTLTLPGESLQKVAKKAIQESNLTWQLSVSRANEDTSLATALNHLIQQMKKSNKQLEIAHQNLEKYLSQQQEEIWQKDAEISLIRQNLHKIESQVAQSEKMSSLGQMLAGIAHEINNPVSFIYGNIKYAQDYVTKLLSLVNLYERQYPYSTTTIEEHRQEIELDFIADDLPKILASLEMGIQRIRQLALSLRNFSRLDDELVKDVDLHAGIEDTLLILSHRLKKGIHVSKKYGILPVIECYPAQLNQVFMNIINNAIDELLAHGELESKQIIIQTEMITPHQLQVRIQDNGYGIPQSIVDKIFDPFFTTKPVGEGTGLGLSICSQIMAKHHGQIQIHSQPGKGSEFVLTLPVEQLLSVEQPLVSQV